MTGVPESIDAALMRLSRLHPKKIDLSLGRIERLLEALGRPQDRLPPVIHIAGTNGKGSVAAFLKAIGEAAGERVHVYTSPHLVRFNERIVLAGEIVDDARLTEAFARCEVANGEEEITFFEITTAAAFLLFSETPAERLILETGLGGRFDATNVVARPQCTVITPVSLDHQEFLGADLVAIASEKAGIFKPGVPAVTAPASHDAGKAFLAAAARAPCPLLMWDRDFRAYGEHGRMVYERIVPASSSAPGRPPALQDMIDGHSDEEASVLWDLPLPTLRGGHQIVNAGLAAAAAHICGYAQEAVARGLETARWPARLQRLTSGPLAMAAVQAEAELWLDGGHNPAAAEALAGSLGELEEISERPLVLICAFSRNKDAAAYLSCFSGMAARVIAITFAGGRDGAHSPSNVAAAARQANIPAQTAASLLDAVQDALEDYECPRIVICGSLYLAGEALAMETGAGVQATPG